MITALHIIGQIIFGGYFAWQGITHILERNNYAMYAASKGVPKPKIAVIGTGILLILGGLGVIFNTYHQIALILLMIFIVPTSIIMHDFWAQTNPGDKSAQKIAFMKNAALFGAMFLMF